MNTELEVERPWRRVLFGGTMFMMVGTSPTMTS
jgi:hypothetical protein